MDTPRTERDLLGNMKLPADAYYGVHTARAIENFPITGTPISTHTDLLVALACVKQAAALANRDLGLLPAENADVIVKACQDIRNGWGHDQFTVDVLQGGAGTSTNMNANEVIANRALELLGHNRGDYDSLDPIEDVNLCQSTNDVYPTAAKLAVRLRLGALRHDLTELRQAFQDKAVEFSSVVKMGRTQLQDAVPMSLGREFGAFGVTFGDDIARIDDAREQMTHVNLGGTAIGTGINAHPRYAATVCRHLADVTGVPIRQAFDLVEATQDIGPFLTVSGTVRRIAIKLSKICNDLRLLASGPVAGLGEIALPPMQGGSSIMPGKINPVIPETVNQIAFEVIGNDVTITLAAEAGQLQLNPFLPVITHTLLTSIDHLAAGCRILRSRCVTGISANTDRLRDNVARSPGIVTALSRTLGYAQCAAIAREALATHRTVAEVVTDRELLPLARLEQLITEAVMPRDPSRA
ncbi:MAG: aspartate ammonia-lyase [Haloechinothrix sp.]